VIFINETGTISKILEAGTQNLTGEMFATLLLILIILMVVCLMFNIPLEIASILILPYCIACGAFYSSFIIAITLIVLYMGFIIAKNWIFR
jgi:hypothetical protein